jgi:hypothetical protein
MRKIVSLISVAAGLCVIAGSAEANPTCALDGVWSTSNQRGAATFTTKVTTATHAFTLDRTGGGVPDAHIVGSYTYDAASSKMVVTNTSVSTQDMAFYACIGTPGTYTVAFTDCTHFTMQLVSDGCTARAQGAGRATFTKQ